MSNTQALDNENRKPPTKFFEKKLQEESVESDRRLTWMCQLQGFLFAALSLTWEKAQSEPFILMLISALGLFAAVLVLKSLLCISRKEHYIAMDLKELYPNYKYSRYHPDQEKGFNYRSPQNGLPLLFVVGWLFVLGYWTFHLQESLNIRYIFIGSIVVFSVLFVWREYCLGRKNSTGIKPGSQNVSRKETHSL